MEHGAGKRVRGSVITMRLADDIVKTILLYSGLFLLLLLAVALTVYAEEAITLEQALKTALKNNPGLKADDSQMETAQAGIIRSRSGFLPKVNLYESWSGTDNPLMVFSAKLNQEIVTQADFNLTVTGFFYGRRCPHAREFCLDRLLSHEYYSLRLEYVSAALANRTRKGEVPHAIL